ncbi:MAG: N-acetylmuramoyl-L-alanine amidase, partial [Maribacter sp.]|nr:N-acetylmuramoyl-L-alanine amidase [Maribacter sp.]
KQAGFIVLHQTFMPSVLIETGFLTNKSEGAFLNSKAGQSKMGAAIAEAILEYKNSVQSNSVQQPELLVEEEVVQKKAEVPVESEPPPVQDKVKETILLTKKEPDGKESDNTKIEETETEDTKEKIEVVAPVEKTVKPVSKPELLFKLQIMASTKNLDLKPQNFNGLGNISKEPYKNLYRYMYGTANSYEEAKMLKSEADSKGYTSSYIVVYKEGVRIPLTEAHKSDSQ